MSKDSIEGREVEGLKYLVIGKEKIPIFLCADGLWRDRYDVVYALRDASGVVDRVTRCGVGVFSLDPSHPLTDACGPHDFAYSSPAYQTFKTRAEADEYLESLVRQIDGGKFSWLASPFRWISRVFGGLFWENKNTK